MSTERAIEILRRALAEMDRPAEPRFPEHTLNLAADYAQKVGHASEAIRGALRELGVEPQR